MEEALQCRAAGAVVTELMGDDADLTATRRLALAAGAGGGLGLILHHQPCRAANAAMTRWEVASAGGERDGFGGLATTDLRRFAHQEPSRAHRPVALVMGSS